MSIQIPDFSCHVMFHDLVRYKLPRVLYRALSRSTRARRVAKPSKVSLANRRQVRSRALRIFRESLRVLVTVDGDRTTPAPSRRVPQRPFDFCATVASTFCVFVSRSCIWATQSRLLCGPGFAIEPTVDGASRFRVIRHVGVKWTNEGMAVGCRRYGWWFRVAVMAIGRLAWWRI